MFLWRGRLIDVDNDARGGGQYRVRTWRVRAWIRGAAAVIVLALCALHVVVIRQVAHGELPPGERRNGFLVIGAVVILAWLWAFRPRVTLAADGTVIVRNAVRSERFHAHEVEDFVFNHSGLVFVLSDGRRPWSIVFQDTMSLGEPRWFDLAEAITGHRPPAIVDEDC